MATQLVMYEEEFTKINAVCDRLTKDANAKVVFLVDKNGQLISAAGQTQNIDTTSLASLTAGNVAATGESIRESIEPRGRNPSATMRASIENARAPSGRSRSNAHARPARSRAMLPTRKCRTTVTRASAPTISTLMR